MGSHSERVRRLVQTSSYLQLHLNISGTSEPLAIVCGPTVTGLFSVSGRRPLTPVLCPGRRRWVSVLSLVSILLVLLPSVRFCVDCCVLPLASVALVFALLPLVRVWLDG